MDLNIHWPRNDYSRVPYRLHHDPEIYELEMEAHLSAGPTWNYLCLEAELPKPHDFRTTWVGDTPVIARATSRARCTPSSTAARTAAR